MPRYWFQPRFSDREWRRQQQSLQNVAEARRDAESVGQNSHLQGTIRSTGEDAVALCHLNLHDSGAEVSEDGLLGVFMLKRVDQTVACQPPHLQEERADNDLVS